MLEHRECAPERLFGSFRYPTATNGKTASGHEPDMSFHQAVDDSQSGVALRIVSYRALRREIVACITCTRRRG
jgi:hypothetical protein